MLGMVERGGGRALGGRRRAEAVVRVVTRVYGEKYLWLVVC